MPPIPTRERPIRMGYQGLWVMASMGYKEFDCSTHWQTARVFVHTQPSASSGDQRAPRAPLAGPATQLAITQDYAHPGTIRALEAGAPRRRACPQHCMRT